MFIYIDMPRFDFPVVFSEQEYPLGTSSSIVSPSSSNISTPNYRLTADATDLFTIVDPEIVRDNPVEAKHRRLVRSHRNGPLDRELKPNAKIRDDLNVSLNPVSLHILHCRSHQICGPGNFTLPTNSSSNRYSKRLNLAISFLPHTRQTSLDQISQVGRLGRSRRSQTSSGDSVTNVGRGGDG